MNDKFESLCAQVYNKIRNKASSKKPITGKELRDYFDLDSRQLQKVLTELRQDYPIVARETYPCGYFVAKNEDDIVNYIQLLQTHVKGYKNTLKLMNAHLADFGDIPRIN